MLCQKKGQLSIFIILGVLILIMFGVLFFLQAQETESIRSEVSERPQLFPVERYVSFCIEQESLTAITSLAKAGGVKEQAQSYTSRFGNVALHYAFEDGNVVMNIPLLESYLEEVIKEQLDSCIQLTNYEQLEYRVTEGEKHVSVQINRNDVLVEVTYPLRLERAGEVIVVDNFAEVVSIPLGQMISLASDITNALLSGPVNMDFYRLSNPQFTFLIERPYPYVIIQIASNIRKEAREYTQFNFAVQLPDLTSLKFSRPELLFAVSKQQDEGSCQIGNMCFSRTKEMTCDLQNGVFRLGGSCPVSSTDDISFLLDSSSGDSCDSWFDIYTGEVHRDVRNHGESWCSVEPGVGGRHYKLSCIDGSVVVEACTDFYQDICGEDIVSGNTVAICRPNRFFTCQTCESQDCCENDAQRDCVWDSSLGCFPVQSPGLRFWNVDSARQICSAGSTSSFLQSERAIKRQAVSCNSVGDCGSGITFLGDYSSQESALTRSIIDKSFFQSLFDKRRPVPISYNAAFFSNHFVPEKSFVPTPSFEFIEVLNAYLRNIDELLVHDIDSILDPFTIIPFDSFSVSTCLPFNPTITNRCSLCQSASVFDGTRNYASCSEYRCRSIGPECTFKMENGIGYCTSPFEDDIPLEIVSLTPEGYSFVEEESSLGRGIRITDDVGLNSPFTLQLETSKDALCKLQYLPDKSFSETSGADLTGQEFRQVHEISLTFSHDFDVFDRILDYFSKDSYSSLLQTLVDLRYRFEALKRQFPQVSRFSSGLYSLLVPIVDFYLDESTQYKLEVLFNNLDDRNYFIFLKCQDLAGRETSDFYFRFRLDDPCFDDTPPKIVHSSHNGDGNLNIFVNEISVCKYDIFDMTFEEMRFDFSCERNPYAVSGIGNGSYLCQTDLSSLLISESEIDVYIRCQDNPSFNTIGDSLSFTFQNSFQYELLNEELDKAVFVRQFDDSIHVDLSELLESHSFGEFEVYINKNFQESMELLFERPMVCSYEDEPLACSSTRCLFPLDTIFHESFTLTCSERVPICDDYSVNSNTESHILTYSKRTLLDIASTAYTNGEFIVTVIDSPDARTECGIQIDSAEGFVRMNQNSELEHMFTQRRTDSRVGAFTAEVFCLNRFGDSVRKTIPFS